MLSCGAYPVFFVPLSVVLRPMFLMFSAIRLRCDQAAYMYGLIRHGRSPGSVEISPFPYVSKKYMACCKKYKPYILKYVPYILK